VQRAARLGVDALQPLPDGLPVPLSPAKVYESAVR
jgi:hypothetical protein